MHCFSGSKEMMEEFIKYVSLAKKGDTEAFAKLYSLVYKDMYHIALYSLRNSQDASDAVSEAVLDAFSSIGNLRSEEAFRHWIMKILSAKIKQKQRFEKATKRCFLYIIVYIKSLLHRDAQAKFSHRAV